MVKNHLAHKIEEFNSQPVLSKEAFLQLLLENRERMIIFFIGSQGTKYQNVRWNLVRFLISAVRQHYPQPYAFFIAKYRDEWILERIYEMLVANFTTVLKEATTRA